MSFYFFFILFYENKMIKLFYYIAIILFSFQILLLLISLMQGIYKYFLISELDLAKRYGKNSWVAITAASSGQGRDFALEFAKRGFNILMIGSKRTIRSEMK
jgi:hypothetical protein